MKKIKRFISIIALLAIGLCSCNGTNIENLSVSQPATNEPTEEITEKITQKATQKQTEKEEEERKYKNMWEYKYYPGGVVLRDVEIKTEKGGEPITVIQLTDLHFNYCNERDLAEADPVILSTYEHRMWLKDGSSLKNTLRVLEYAKDADQLVITGDMLDYLSYGCIEMAQKYIFDEYPDVMACLGNHEMVRQMQGTVADTKPLEERMATLEEIWPHDIYYSSKVLDERVMLIQMDNSATSAGFWDCQVEPFANDLALAREKGYTVLLFYHVPLATMNPEFKNIKSSMIGDNSCAVMNFKDNGVQPVLSDASAKIYDMITNNADIIAGCFCGHMHNDFYTEIIAKNADGSDAVIPQYILIGVPYGEGQLLRITVK